MRIVVAVTDDVFDTGLASLLDTFETANELAGEARFAVTVVSPRATVRTHHGFAIRPAKPPVRAPDLVMVPALACKQPATIVGALDTPDVRNLIDLVARYLLIDNRPSQAPFIAPAHVACEDELVKKFERWVRRHLAEPFELARAARAVGASERTLQRHIGTVLGKPPIAFVQDLRLERAAHLLRVTDDSVDRIAGAVGYEDGSTLRTLLRRKLRTGVRELRAR